MFSRIKREGEFSKRKETLEFLQIRKEQIENYVIPKFTFVSCIGISLIFHSEIIDGH